MKPLIFFCIFLLNTTLSCKKHKNDADNPYGLPNASQNGANVFACRINDQNYIAYNDINHIGASISNDTILIGGRTKKPYYESLLIQIKTGSAGVGTYTINNNSFAEYITDSLCTGLVTSLYQFHAISGSIQLTKLDKTNKIVAGTFNLVIPVTNCDTLKIIDGRLDINYY